MSLFTSFLKNDSKKVAERFRLEVSLHGLTVQKESLLLNKQVVFDLVRSDKVVSSKTYFLRECETQLDEKLVMLVTLRKDLKTNNYGKKKYSIQLKEVGAKKAETVFKFDAALCANSEDLSIEFKGESKNTEEENSIALHTTVSCPLEANYERPGSDVSDTDIPDDRELLEFEESLFAEEETKSNFEEMGSPESSQHDTPTGTPNTNKKEIVEEEENNPSTGPADLNDERFLKLQEEIFKLKQERNILQQQRSMADIAINGAINQLLVLSGSSPNYEGADPTVLQSWIRRVSIQMQQLEIQSISSRRSSMSDASMFEEESLQSVNSQVTRQSRTNSVSDESMFGFEPLLSQTDIDAAPNKELMQAVQTIMSYGKPPRPQRRSFPGYTVEKSKRDQWRRHSSAIPSLRKVSNMYSHNLSMVSVLNHV